MTDNMEFARKQSKMSEWVWYQINGKSAQENYFEQHKKMIENIQNRIDVENEVPQIRISSEAKVK